MAYKVVKSKIERKSMITVIDHAFVKLVKYTFEDFQKIFTVVSILFPKNDNFTEYSDKTLS